MAIIVKIQNQYVRISVASIIYLQTMFICMYLASLKYHTQPTHNHTPIHWRFSRRWAFAGCEPSWFELRRAA